ncbi:hypothetical protein BGZ72_006417 [Mortierella alpina]|nr:hypothetical protein BGZ72_006417 [Mortierella alpina]
MFPVWWADLVQLSVSELDPLNLNMRSNLIWLKARAALSEAIETSSTLNVSMEGNLLGLGWGPAESKLLSEALRTQLNYRYFEVGVKSIGDSGTQTLAEALKQRDSDYYEL